MLAIRERRIAQGMSQKALAGAAGVGERTIRRVEAGDHVPHGAALVGIAHALGVTLDDLFHAADATASRESTQKNAPAARKRPGA